MTDINNLVQEFRKISSGRPIDVSLTPICRLLEILQVCFSFVFATAVDSTNKSEYLRILVLLMSIERWLIDLLFSHPEV